MKLKICTIVIAIILALFNSSKTFAQRIKIVTTAVPFLRISPDARAGGMGNVSVATTADANAIFYNLAKTPFNTARSSIALTYTPWLRDIVNDVYMLNMAGYYKLDDVQSASAAIRYFNLGSISFTDFQGNSLGQGRPRELAIDLGYARKLSDRLSLGITLRYINSNLASGVTMGNSASYKPGNAVAGDIASYYNAVDEIGMGWRFGVVFSNLGSKIAYTSNANQKDYIPANLALGASYTHIFQEVHSLSFGIDINKLLVPVAPTPVEGDVIGNNNLLEKYRSQSVVSSWFKALSGTDNIKETQVSIGGEYWYNNQFAFRAGYNYAFNAEDRRYAAIGAGVKYNAFQLHFSYLIPANTGVVRNPLSNTLRFGLTFDMDGKKE